MRLPVVFGILASGLILAGCAGLAKNRIHYKGPDASKVINSEVINSSFSKTWDRLIGNLSSQYFVINNVEKASRIINVSFSSDSPTEYIDCGRTNRTFIPGPGTGQTEQTYSYETATGSTSFNAATPNPRASTYSIPGVVHRTTEVTGRTNIYLAPEGKNKTKISVNTRYIFTINSQFSSGSWTQSWTPVTISFNTNKVGEKVLAGGDAFKTLQCVTAGTIERDVIAAAKP